MDGGPHTLASLIRRSAVAALHAGPPAHVYHYKTFTIMVWNHNLLDNLDKTPGIQSGGALSSRLRVARLKVTALATPTGATAAAR